ncbi:hypothetical protein DUNSADRAFT_12252 [Dunaliella salina]|uniref:PAS domain-containing protein n=1 Tax=Dunaliella salina TaxID=3046 RepID=A0ABQ7GBM2_DUNSA|nr:hypothetical protein DUNSADRAFT_12252 [Dunaliella salina]|eukprot:KAF5832011.1 hypothetical protein DUNSADRAFT_12252 [Dunaliella salina]
MSVSSGGSSAGLSTTSSRESAVQHLNKRAKAKDGGDEDEDLLEEKRSFQEFCYYCMDTLSAEKAFTVDWRINLPKIVLEGLTGFLVVFNPLVQGWDIDYNLWFWQIISWSTYHSAVAINRDYNVYTNVMYLHVAVVGLLLAGLALLALTVNKVQKSKELKKWVKVLHFCMDVVFTVGFMTIFSVFTFMFNCDFQANNNGGTNMHLHFRDVDCSEVPHLVHMIVGGIFALILGILACIMAIADTEHNPISRTWLASPSTETRMKIVVAKMVIVVCAVGINETRRAPTIIVWLAALYTWWLYFRQMPFYNTWVNISISSMWLGIAFTASLLMVLSWDHRNGDPDFHYWMTWNVLKGIFPVMVGGACCHYAFIWYKMYWTRKFVDPPPNLPLRKIFKFEYPEDVEIMSRAMRKFDRDGVVDPQAVELGDTILRAGMQYFPKCPGLLVLYASMLLEVKHDGPLTRTQLQNAMKLRPDILDKYRIFVIAQRAKRMKDAADGTMDLQSYVEFKRNYRMLARVHKEALQNQRDFWKLFMHSKTQESNVKKALKDLEASSSRAQMVYSKIMERYPNNGKLLKCYGKFLEEVKNDIGGATKYYSEGNRLGSTDAIMNMDFDLAGRKKMDFLVSMDLHEDAVVIIDAVGTILMISQGTTAMFGYSKIELENANVSMLMPQPFSQRHPSYLQRYTSTGDPHILDKVQEVVALHKEKFVFPTELGVTKLSGSGSDSVFLGVLKAMPVSMETVRVWVAPNGVVLCADQQFSGLMGYPSEALVGTSIFSLLEDPSAGEAFNEQCKAASPEDFAQQRIKTTGRFVGKYLPPVPCSVTVKLGGTQTERIFVWNVKRNDKNDEMTMVCDTHGTITFATWDMAALLGMSTRKLVGTKLDTLLPPPYNSMHAKWLQETPSVIPSSSCRAGVVVQLLNSSHVLVPVRIKVHQMEDQGRTLHVVRVTRAAPNALVEEKRVSLTCNLNGTIEEIEPAESQLFGWPAMEMKGRHVADVVDTFATWRQKIADQYFGGDVERCIVETGTGGVKLLLLAFMDQEYARPGGSYRVSVKPPDTDFATAIAAAQNTQHQVSPLLGY